MKNNTPAVETYIRYFVNGPTATIKLTESSFSCEWSTPPEPKHIPEYLKWRNESVLHFYTKTGKKVLIVTY